MSDVPNSNWFVVQLRPNGLAQARENLRRQNFGTFSPDHIGLSQRRGRVLKLRQPLFPGYLFVSFDPNVTGWTAINNTRGVSRLILSDPRRPRPLPAKLIAGLKARCDPSDLVAAADDLEVGDRIRILSGPFADLVTSIDLLPDAKRVRILLGLMGRDVRTTLPRNQVSKIA